MPSGYLTKSEIRRKLWIDFKINEKTTSKLLREKDIPKLFHQNRKTHFMLKMYSIDAVMKLASEKIKNGEIKPYEQIKRGLI